jgi:valyl-tRNA synthetase
MKELSKNFDFAAAEARLYEAWEAAGYFKPEAAPPDAKPFVIAIPPPNVTGALHLGHAMFVSVEDLMIRQARMKGQAALWIPGTDHAGIATQLQVEKLLREEGTSREQVGREAFIGRTWAWKAKYGGEIQNQLRRLGASCDWERERFTMDEGLSKAVTEAFVRLHEQGLIYRGTRLINWSPGLKTAVSDLEVEDKAIPEAEGRLYFFRYPVEGGEFIPVATTRPETILGDTAVAVNPNDPRYQHLIGRTAFVPMLNRPIPVIADAYVEMDFGTGALKVTPGHDFNDYTLAQRHGLPIISIMNRDASLNEQAGPYAGLDRFAARHKLWADMEAAGLVIEAKPYAMTVPVSQRGGEIIEPMISEQWFVSIQPLADKAMAAVREGKIRIVPERFEKVYYHWLENIQDWCISRQLWWGHRIPAWYHAETGEIRVTRDGAPDESGLWIQDPDVLDTWFSSGLWPFSTLGWPDQTPDLARYYPGDILETGYDILFFWVLRMIMMGLWFTDEAPFHTVYLHGLIRDENGEKMAKTKGNVIDPLLLMDKYGADALRFTLLTGSTPGNDMNLAEARVEYSRNFGNKLWQAARFIQSNLGDTPPLGRPDPAGLDLPSRWILSRLSRLVGSADYLFSQYQYAEAGRQMLDFLWEDFAPYYVEISKHLLYGEDESAKQTTRQVLLYSMETLLRLLHPYMPYMTEEIWAALPHPPGESPALIMASWPANPGMLDEAAEEQMRVLNALVAELRLARAEYNVDPGKRLEVYADPGSYGAALADYGYVFGRLCNIEALHFAPPPAKSAAVVAADVTLYLPLEGMIDLDKERARLQKDLGNLEKQIEGKQKQLGNAEFVGKASPEVVQGVRDKLSELQASQQALQKRLEVLA